MSLESWIKLRTKLPKDGRLRIAARKCHASTVTCVGALVTLWCLADEQADDEGVLLGYAAEDVDEIVGVDGFCESLPSDWIDLTGEWVKLPQYQEHNGSTAKSRAQATKRKQNERSATPVANTSRSIRDKNATREEKSRQEQKLHSLPCASEPADADESTPNSGLGSMHDDTAHVVVIGAGPATVALRKVGVKVNSLDPVLLALLAEDVTPAEMCMVAAQKAIDNACLNNDPDVDPDLLEMLANGFNQQQMRLTDAQWMLLQRGMPGINYIASAARGKRDDATRMKARKTDDQRAKSTDTSHGGDRSAVGRVRAANAAAEFRERTHAAGDA